MKRGQLVENVVNILNDNMVVVELYLHLFKRKEKKANAHMQIGFGAVLLYSISKLGFNMINNDTFYFKIFNFSF